MHVSGITIFGIGTLFTGKFSIKYLSDNFHSRLTFGPLQSSIACKCIMKQSGQRILIRATHLNLLNFFYHPFIVLCAFELSGCLK